MNGAMASSLWTKSFQPQPIVDANQFSLPPDGVVPSTFGPRVVAVNDVFNERGARGR
jgi:hypothetical protein